MKENMNDLEGNVIFISVIFTEKKNQHDFCVFHYLLTFQLIWPKFLNK